MSVVSASPPLGLKPIAFTFTNNTTGEVYTGVTGTTIEDFDIPLEGFSGQFPAGSYTIAASVPEGHTGYTVEPTTVDADVWCHKDVPIVFTLIDHAPTLSMPDDMVVQATSNSGAEVSFDVTADDSEDGDLGSVPCSPLSGSTFAIGVTQVECSVTDSAGNTTAGTFRVIVYDPGAGFVTGGGWINSPPGAYTADPLATGRVNFGVNAKYLNNQPRLTGETEFQLQLADINFHSTGYSWLVVVGPNSSVAVWEGAGTINGEGNFRFQFTVVDGDRDGTRIDKMRMRIWNAATGAVIYDTGGTPIPLASGSIVIHVR